MQSGALQLRASTEASTNCPQMESQMPNKSKLERIYLNTLTGKRIPFAVFQNCESGCPEEFRCLIPPKPYEVDSDYWFFRPIRPDENPEELDDATPGYLGFVSKDRTRLYIRGLEYDPNPAVPFVSLGFPKHSELFKGEPL